MIRRHILRCTSRIAEYHSKITFVNSFKRNREVISRLIRHIIFRVSSRFIILICIDPEKREIACMSWPHPVIGIAAEISNCGRRSSNQPYIPVCFIYKKKKLVTHIKGTNKGSILSTILCFSNKSQDIYSP